MSKFASTSVLLLSLALIAAGALVPRIEFLAFLAEFANIISLAGGILLAIFLIAAFGLKGLLYLVVYLVIFIAIRWGIGFVFSLLGLGGLVFDLVGFLLAILGTSAVAGKIM